jgi:hypothetical protein
MIRRRRENGKKMMERRERYPIKTGEGKNEYVLTHTWFSGWKIQYILIFLRGNLSIYLFFRGGLSICSFFRGEN